MQKGLRNYFDFKQQKSIADSCMEYSLKILSTGEQNSHFNSNGQMDKLNPKSIPVNFIIYKNIDTRTLVTVSSGLLCKLKCS